MVDSELPFDPPVEPASDPADEGWLTDKGGKHYIPNPTGRGTLRRAGTETVGERIARQAADAGPAAPRVRKRGRRRGKDPKPAAGSTPRPKPAVSDLELQQLLEGLLAAPAIYAAAPRPIGLDCAFCAEHFATQAGPTSVQLVALAAENPGLRRVLIQLHDSWVKITYGGIIAAYVAKPMIHHLAPEPVLENVGGVLGIPPRTPAQEEAHQHAHANGTSPPPQYARAAPRADTPPPPPTGL
jgi:hypothetical protein